MSAGGLESLRAHCFQVLQVGFFFHNYRYLSLIKCLDPVNDDRREIGAFRERFV